jgi:hypothetical protein
MSHTRIQRMGAVRQEYQAARRAVAFFVEGWSVLVNTVDVSPYQQQDFRAAYAGLETTYLIRLFSQFETELRIFVREQGRRVLRPAESLINRMASMLHIEADIVANVHAVRQYRNRLVHEEITPTVAIPFEDALPLLNRFLA